MAGARAAPPRRRRPALRGRRSLDPRLRVRHVPVVPPEVAAVGPGQAPEQLEGEQHEGEGHPAHVDREGGVDCEEPYGIELVKLLV